MHYSSAESVRQREHDSRGCVNWPSDRIWKRCLEGLGQKDNPECEEHYELAGGRDPMLFIVAMEVFANAGGWSARSCGTERLRGKNYSVGINEPKQRCIRAIRKDIEYERDEN